MAATEGWCNVQLGQVESRRPAFHDAHNIWPIGFKSTLRSDDGTIFIFKILDSIDLNCSRKNEFADDMPVFAVEVRHPRENLKTLPQSCISGTLEKEEFFDTSLSRLWAQVSSKYGQHLSAKDRFFGFDSADLQKIIEGLEGAADCEDYEFIEMRLQLSRDCAGLESTAASMPNDNKHTQKTKIEIQPPDPQVCLTQTSAGVRVQYCFQPKADGAHPKTESIWIPASAQREGKAGGSRWLLYLCDGTLLKMRSCDPRLRLAPAKGRSPTKHLWAGLAISQTLTAVPESAVDVLELAGMMLSFRLVEMRLATGLDEAIRFCALLIRPFEQFKPWNIAPRGSLPRRVTASWT